MSIRVRSGYDTQLTQLLREGEVDFALTEISRNPDKKDLVQEPLIHCRYVIACRQGHPLAGRKRVPLERLLAYRWALPDLALSAQDRLAGLFRSENLPVPKAHLQSTSFSFILRLLETSDALSFVVESSLCLEQHRSITSVDIDKILPVRHAGVVMRKDSWFNPAGQALISALREHCGRNPIQ